MEGLKNWEAPKSSEAGCLSLLLPMCLVFSVLIGGATFFQESSPLPGLIFLVIALAAWGWAWSRFAAPVTTFSLHENGLLRTQRFFGHLLSERLYPRDELVLLVDRTVGPGVRLSAFTRAGEKLDLYRMPADPYLEVQDFGHRLARDLTVEYVPSGDDEGAGWSEIHHDDRPHRVRVEHATWGEWLSGCCGCYLILLGLGLLSSLETSSMWAGAATLFYPRWLS